MNRKCLISCLLLLIFLSTRALGEFNVTAWQDSGTGWSLEYEGTIVSGTYPVGEPQVAVVRNDVNTPPPGQDNPAWVQFCSDSVGCTIMGQDGISLYKQKFDQDMRVKVNSIRAGYDSLLRQFDSFDQSNPVFKTLHELKTNEVQARDKLITQINTDSQILSTETPKEVKTVYIASALKEILVLETITGFGSNTPGLFDLGKVAGFGMLKLSSGVEGVPPIIIHSTYSDLFEQTTIGSIPLVGSGVALYEVMAGIGFYPPHSPLSVSDRIFSGAGVVVTNSVLLKTFRSLESVEALQFLSRTFDNVPQEIIRPVSNVLDSLGSVRERITPLGEHISETTIPKYFRLKTGGAEFFVNPNATKHMGEYISRLPMSPGFPLRNDLILASFEIGVRDAVKSGAWKVSLDSGNPIISGGWELIFAKRSTDELVVIKHALMKD